MPQRVRLASVSVAGFRGVLERRTLKFGGKSIALFGENGTGKSTFVDGIERLLAGRISTLDGRGQGLSSQQHARHIRASTADETVEAQFTDPESTRISGSTEGAPASLGPYLEGARNPVYILRRRNILDFIESQPRERYELLRPFLPLRRIEEIEAAFRSVSERLDSSHSRSADELRARRARVASLLQLDLRSATITDSDVLSSVRGRFQAMDIEGPSSLADLSLVQAALDVQLEAFGDTSTAATLSGALGALAELRSATEALDLDELTAAVDSLRAQEARAPGKFYDDVVEHGLKWIGEERRDTCPLCEQRFFERSRDQVVARAHERLEAHRALIEARQSVMRARTRLGENVRAARSAVERTLRALADVEDADELRLAVEAAQDSASQLLEALSQPSVDPARLTEIGVQLSVLMSANGPIATGSQQIQLALNALPSPKRARELLGLRDLLSRLELALKEMRETEAEVKRAQTQLRAATTVRDVLERERKAAVQRLFNRIAGDVERLYRALHAFHEENEDEPAYGGIRIDVRPAVQGSATLRSDFFEKKATDPRAYYSDAHLDTLGIAIFLALRRWYRECFPSFDLIILDDVLTSIDSAHAEHLAELLLREFFDYQILITTHDRIWFEHLKDIQARCGVSQNFINKVIHKWTIAGGPDLREPRDEFESLRDELLEHGTAKEIASMAGRLLEHVLQEMRYSLRLRVPAKPGESYEIGDLWPAFYSEVRKNYPGLYDAARSTLDSLNVNWTLRNWIGAHFNAWASNVAREKAVSFGNCVIRLFEAAYCDSCRRFVKPSSTPLGQIACQCGSKLYSAKGKPVVGPTDRAAIVEAAKGSLADFSLDSERHLEWKRAEHES